VEPKQTETGQNEDKQGKKDKSERNMAKQSEIKWTKNKCGNSGWNSVITVVWHPNLLVSEQKLRNKLFRYFAIQPKQTPLFRIVSKLVS
jgi:hypothetical protein